MAMLSIESAATTSRRRRYSFRRGSSLTKHNFNKTFGNLLSLGNAKVPKPRFLFPTEKDLGRVSYCRPRGLDVLCNELTFTKDEIKWMYNNFKQECPSGEMTESQFCSIYSRFFAPGVNSERYSKHLYRVMLDGTKGLLTFEVFMRNLMVVERQSIRERFQFMFSLYDVKNDGVITKDEVIEIVESVYSMAGWNGEKSDGIDRHVEEVFSKFDINGDGEVSKEEFIYICLDDEVMKESVAALRTV